MSHVLKSKPIVNSTPWMPSASKENRQARANLLAAIREFFSLRNVLEVETPLVSHTSVTDPYIQSIPVLVQKSAQAEQQRYFLQTSPEYAMKRLLAAGSGSIYQICKAFRQGEVGRFHNPEFSMLEWYRLDFNHIDLIEEMDLFLQTVANMPAAKKVSYADLFQDFLQINPHTADIACLKDCLAQRNIQVQVDSLDKDTWLELLMSHCIEPELGREQPCILFDFPASQAALARIQAGEPPLAARFEVYIQGMELANGFHELTDAAEQRQRFEKNLHMRQQMGLDPLPLDENFLSALQAGLPDCAGVALGLDRLLMLITQSNHIQEVLNFAITRA